MFAINIDPFETQNRYGSLTADERQHMHKTLEQLRGCRGRSCTIQKSGSAFFMPQIQHQRNFKRKYDSFG